MYNSDPCFVKVVTVRATKDDVLIVSGRCNRKKPVRQACAAHSMRPENCWLINTECCSKEPNHH